MSITDSSSNPFESPRESNKKAEERAPAPVRRGKLAPPFGVRLTAAGFLLTAGIVRWFTITGDRAIVNVLTFLMGLLACITLSIWFTFFSGYRRAIRWGVTLGTFGLLFLLIALYRVDRVSGELVPTFRPRWTKR